MEKIYTPNGKGVDTDKHWKIQCVLSDVEVRMVEKLKKHYKFQSDRELIVALLKRANMNI